MTWYVTHSCFLCLVCFTLCCVANYRVSSTKLGWLDCSLTAIMYTETPILRNGSPIETCLQTSLSGSHFRIAFTWIPQLWPPKGERGSRFVVEGKLDIQLWLVCIFVLTVMFITSCKTSPISCTGSVPLWQERYAYICICPGYKGPLMFSSCSKL